MVARRSMGAESLRSAQAVAPDQEVMPELPHASSLSSGDMVVVVYHLT